MAWHVAKWGLVVLGAATIWAASQPAAGQQGGPADATVSGTEDFKEKTETAKPGAKKGRSTGSSTERAGTVEPGADTPEEAKEKTPRRDPKAKPTYRQ